jgi:hypothetical protein
VVETLEKAGGFVHRLFSSLCYNFFKVILMQTREIAAIKDEVKGLSPEQKVDLIKFLADTLTVEASGSVPLQFGKYASTSRPMSSPNTFKLPNGNLPISMPHHP